MATAGGIDRIWRRLGRAVARRAKLTVAEAEATLRYHQRNPSFTHGDRRGPFPGQTIPKFRSLDELLRALPEGVKPALVAKVVGYSKNFSSLAKLPEHLDDAIYALIKSRLKSQRFKDADCAFVNAGLSAFQDADRHDALRDLVARTGTLQPMTETNRASLARLIAKHPEYVVGAQAAVAIEGLYMSSIYLPILVVEASPDSLDILLPELERLRDRNARYEVEWMIGEVVPRLGKTAAAKSFVELLTGDADL